MVKLSTESFLLLLSSKYTMDYRRVFGLRAPCPIGDSTVMVPQLENYSLFAMPFLELTKNIGAFLKDHVQAAETKADEEAEQEKKTKVDFKKLLEEFSIDNNFGIVLNVVTVETGQLTIQMGDDNKIKVHVKQEKDVSKLGSIPFSRDCLYEYELPDNVDKKKLVALRTSDDYLIILPRDHLREDLLKKSLAEKPKEASDKDVVPPDTDLAEQVESKPGTSTKEIEPKKPSGSKQIKEKTKPKKPSDKDLVKSDVEEMDVEFVVEDGFLQPLLVSSLLRPALDIFMLRKYMVDLESYVSTARKFIENASFITLNSKTSERCIRFLAKARADDHFEDPNLKDNKRKSKPEPTPDIRDSGYSSLPDGSDGSSKDGSSTKDEKDADSKSESVPVMLDNPQLKEMLKSPPKE